MMLDFLGHPQPAEVIRRSAASAVADKALHPRDLGGTAGTNQITDAVCKLASA
jgi:tartrate dehydrogenase/decarboxylase/D-malate dehydrogenase